MNPNQSVGEIFGFDVLADDGKPVGKGRCRDI
jgi:hypothetical protein